VPTHNRAALLQGCLDSLTTQDYAPTSYEVVVVDDGSSDSTETVVTLAAKSGGPDVRYVRQSHRGPNQARNAGIRASRGDPICFVDDDIVAPPSWLDRLTAGLADDVEMTFGPVLLAYDVHLPSRHGEEAAILSVVAEPRFPLLCNIAVRRQVFSRGLFNPDWSAPVEEIEWISRVSPAMRLVREAHILHRRSSQDVTWQRVMRLAWRRGHESGRYAAKRERAGFMACLSALMTMTRAVGHCVRSRCWGGCFVAVGRFGYIRGWAAHR
jgi:glycosyltransferase involved in cell wall biosynthesis